MRISFTEEQQRAIRSHTLHSTARETPMVLTAVKVLLQAIPHIVSGTRIEYLTDSQVTFYSFSRMRADTLESLETAFQAYDLCRRHDVWLSVAWSPRSDVLLQEADSHARMEDPSHWAWRTGPSTRSFMPSAFPAPLSPWTPSPSRSSPRLRDGTHCSWPWAPPEWTALSSDGLRQTAPLPSLSSSRRCPPGGCHQEDHH